MIWCTFKLRMKLAPFEKFYKFTNVKLKPKPEFNSFVLNSSQFELLTQTQTAAIKTFVKANSAFDKNLRLDLRYNKKQI